MSIASQFRFRYGVALASADATKGQNNDARCTALMQAFDKAELVLMDKEMVAILMEQAKGHSR